MGLKPVETAIAADSPEAIKRGLAKWQSAVDDVVIRAITAKDTVEDHPGAGARRGAGIAFRSASASAGRQASLF